MNEIKVICIPMRKTILEKSAEILVRHWKKQTRVEIKVCDMPPEADGVVLVMTAGLTGKWKEAFERFTPDADALKDDGYILKSVKWNGRGQIVAAGKSPTGTKQALYRLLREVQFEKGKVFFPDVAYKEEPFFGKRYVVYGDPSPNSLELLPEEDRKRAMFELWDKEKRLRYAEGIEAMGFNSMMATDESENYKVSGYLLKPEYWKQELINLYEHMGELGTWRIHFFWATFTGYPFIKERRVIHGKQADWGRGLNPDNPADKKIWQAHLESAIDYAPVINEVCTHWADPGGWEGETIEDALRIHERIMAEFQKGNHKATSLFSIWSLHADNKLMTQPDSFEKIISGKILSPDVGIATHGRVDMVQAKAIKKAGRRCGPWVWYLADYEIVPSLHIHTRWLDEYFMNLPQEAAEVTDFHGMDNNSHSFNMASLYVGARKLWNPYVDSDTLLREFCCLVFGPKLADSMFHAYSVIAEVRCGNDDYGELYSSAGMPGRYSWHKPFLPIFCDLRSHELLVRDAIDDLKAASVDNDWISRLILPVEPEVMLEDVKIHLREILRYVKYRRECLNVYKGKDKITNLPVWRKSKTKGRLLFMERHNANRVLKILNAGEKLRR